MTQPAVTQPSLGGLWRVGRAQDPYSWSRSEPIDPTQETAKKTGNRFDSFAGTYGVLYFGTSQETCFAETLARFRPNPRLVELARQDWLELGCMEPGAIAADWRHKRLLTRVRLVEPLPFLNIDAPDTLNAIANEPYFEPWWEIFGLEDVDLSTVLSNDRRITRLISQWAADLVDEDGNYCYSGIRYTSRLGEGWECWAVFEGTMFEEVERLPILLGHPDLKRVAERYGITVY